MAGTMQHDDAHKWRNVPVSHDNLSAAKERVPGVSEIAREALALWLDEHEQED